MGDPLRHGLHALDIAATDQRFAAVNQLALWLKQSAPNFLLMPVSVHCTPTGDPKGPARAHKDAYRQRALAPGQLIGILMRDLI